MLLTCTDLCLYLQSRYTWGGDGEAGERNSEHDNPLHYSKHILDSVRRQRELVAYAYMANRCPLQEEGRQKGTSSGRINEENPPLW